MNYKLWMSWMAFGLALVVMVAVASPAWAAKGGDPGPPTGGEVSNNLSFPSVLTEAQTSIAAYWTPPDPSVLGEHYSYGCDKLQMVGQFSYPNTTCVDDPENPFVYLTAEDCTALGAPCEGLPLSRIYWQKVDANEWWADEEGSAADPAGAAREVAYVDWGDALEAVSWN